jgi:menaquinone-dependent protoporphyrinogen IX oxidase
MSGKTLVAYYTKGGASGTYAQAIVEGLSEKGIRAEIVDLRERVPDVSGYDAVIAGTGVRMFMVYGRWKKVLKQKDLKSRKLFMFLSSGMAIDKPDEAVEKFLRPITAKYKLSPILMVSFPGMIPDKWKEPGKENDTVKPELARKWAGEIAERLKEAGQ